MPTNGLRIQEEITRLQGEIREATALLQRAGSRNESTLEPVEDLLDLHSQLSEHRLIQLKYSMAVHLSIRGEIYVIAEAEAFMGMLREIATVAAGVANFPDREVVRMLDLADEVGRAIEQANQTSVEMAYVPAG